MVDTPFTSFAYALAGGTATRTTPARFGDIVNGAEFELVGDGSFDNNTRLQAALDATFGSYLTPATHNKFTNRWLLLPAGNFRYTGPLYLHNVTGGGILGVGAEATKLSNEWTNAGNAIATSTSSADAVNPAIMLAGCSNMEFGGFTLGGNNRDGNSTHRPVGLFIYQGPNQQGSTTNASSANIFRNMIVGGFWGGCLGGLGGDGGQCDGMTFINVVFNSCRSYGLKPGHQNALNYVTIGGGGTGCALNDDGTLFATGALGNAAALYASQSCPMTHISPQTSGNGVDFCNASGGSFVIQGGSSESIICLQSAAPSFISGFSYRYPQSIAQSGPLAGTPCTFIDATSGGPITATNCSFAPGEDHGAGNIAILSNSAYVKFDNLAVVSGGTSSKITGTPAGVVELCGRSSEFGGFAILSAYTGMVKHDIGVTTVSALPTAAGKYTGLRATVTDASNTTAVGDTVAGSGSKVANVFCTGAAWKVVTVY